ncbi:MAG TPA: hypothetical protein EYP14_07855 [Planctomycetaceae bacterium]|nr:hypothetical protein [Planctomycetaceae bacterium]
MTSLEAVSVIWFVGWVCGCGAIIALNYRNRPPLLFYFVRFLLAGLFWPVLIALLVYYGSRREL